MTPEGQNERDPARQGRRSGDRWTRRRIIEIGTIVGLLWSGYTVISSYFAARWATHSEVSDAVKPVVDTLRDFRRDVIPRLRRVEFRQDSAEAINDLLIANSRYNCLVAERDRSKSIAEAAGLPCNTLLGRIR